MEYSPSAAERCRTIWVLRTVCLYARFFFRSSITIMATVWVVFPSEPVGGTATRSGEDFLPLFENRNLGLSIDIPGLVFCAPHLLDADLPPSTHAKHCQFPGALARQVQDG